MNDGLRLQFAALAKKQPDCTLLAHCRLFIQIRPEKDHVFCNKYANKRTLKISSDKGIDGLGQDGSDLVLSTATNGKLIGVATAWA